MTKVGQCEPASANICFEYADLCIEPLPSYQLKGTFMRTVLVISLVVGLGSTGAFAAPTACELISAAEMSEILGSAVKAPAP